MNRSSVRIVLAVGLAALVIACSPATPAPSASATGILKATATATRTAGPTGTSTVAAASTRSTAAPPAGSVLAVVVDVVDGDTFDVRLAGATKRIRLILVDTPEVYGGVQCFGREASNYTKALLPAGTALHLERDVSETDRFDRLLRYAYLADGRMVNELLVRDGFARVATFPPDVKYVDRLRAVEREARDANRGLWSGCASSVPPPASTTALPAAGTTVAPAGASYYANCAAARAAGAAPIRRGQPGYRDALDGDRDGIACE